MYYDCVSLIFNLSDPLFACLKNGDINSTYLLVLLSFLISSLSLLGIRKNKLNSTALRLTLDFIAKILKVERNWQRRKISRAPVKLTPGTFYSWKSANNIIIPMNSCTFGVIMVSIPRELFPNYLKIYFRWWKIIHIPHMSY